jgi:hypothetical protein
MIDLGNKHINNNMSISQVELSFLNNLITVDLSLFVEYQFLWISLVSSNHEIHCCTKGLFNKRVMSKYQKHEFKCQQYLFICLSMKIDTNKN